ncbi:MAG: DNA recombination/repair protein RecA [Gemmatimonadaceae bacterium]|nr:DNA recombination/repair protein RecA [Gemmatimonadaceae bacterium]
MSASVAASLEALTPLRAQLDAVVIGGRTTGAPWPTGVPRLDRALGGGVPRGRITELSGPLAVGKTALLRQVVARVLHSGAWVAWIDARHTLAPAPWADLGERFVVVRPPDAKRSAWAADLLLRSGVFGLVVIDGAPPLTRVQGVRLGQLARERDAACVVLEHLQPGESRNTRLAGTVRVRLTLSLPPSLHQASRRRRPGSTSSTSSTSEPAMSVTVEKGAASHHQPSAFEVPRVVVVARRVCTDSEIPDRRGVARSARRPWAARGNSTDTHTDAAGQPVAEHPVTWGGLGVGSHDLYGTDLPGHPARLAAGLDDAPDRLSEQHTRELDRLTRDWTTYRGRRRAAESGYGRRSRRELARERTGAILTSHSGQSRGSNGSPRVGRDGRQPERERERQRDPAALG